MAAGSTDTEASQRHQHQRLGSGAAGCPVDGIIIGQVSEYYPAGSPVRHIAKSAETGPATVIITGLSAGIYGVGIAEMAAPLSRGTTRSWIILELPNRFNIPMIGRRVLTHGQRYHN